MDLYVDKTMLGEALKSLAGSTAVQTMYIIAVCTCKLSDWLVWLSTRLQKQCQRFLVFAKNKKSGQANVASRSGEEEAKRDGEVPQVDIT